MTSPLPPTPEVANESAPCEPRRSVLNQPFRKRFERPEYMEDPEPQWSGEPARPTGAAMTSPAPALPVESAATPRMGAQQESPCE